MSAIYARCCEPTRYPSNPVFMMRDGCGWTGEVERVSEKAGSGPPGSTAACVGVKALQARAASQPSEITHDDLTDSGAPAPDEPTGKLEYPHAEIGRNRGPRIPQQRGQGGDAT